MSTPHEHLPDATAHRVYQRALYHARCLRDGYKMSAGKRVPFKTRKEREITQETLIELCDIIANGSPRGPISGFAVLQMIQEEVQ